MIELSARYFDGQKSHCHTVRIQLLRSGLTCLIEGEPARTWPSAEVEIQPRLGNTCRIINLGDGGRIEVDDHEKLEAALARSGWEKPAGAGWVHRLESRGSWVAVAVIITLFAGWAIVMHGVPALADRAAQLLPPEVDIAITAQTMTELDRLLFTPSKLDADVQDHVRAVFLQAAGAADESASRHFRFRLAFRHSEVLGANALALPAGTVVITDDLVNLSENDEELFSILAHEVGHVLGRHALRHVLQDAAVLMLYATVVGDVVSASTLAAALPSFLLQASYSRDFEREADRYAFARMQQAGIPPSRFADILSRMEAQGSTGLDVPPYLSTHPPTKERVQQFTPNASP